MVMPKSRDDSKPAPPATSRLYDSSPDGGSKKIEGAPSGDRPPSIQDMDVGMFGSSGSTKTVYPSARKSMSEGALIRKRKKMRNASY